MAIKISGTVIKKVLFKILCSNLLLIISEYLMFFKTEFQAIWHPKREDIILVGSMNRPRQIDILSDKGVPYPSLKGEDLGSICSLIAYHPTQEIVVGGNSSGRVHYFK